MKICNSELIRNAMEHDVHTAIQGQDVVENGKNVMLFD